MQETLERTKLRKPEVLKPSSKRLCVWFQETDQADMFSIDRSRHNAREIAAFHPLTKQHVFYFSLCALHFSSVRIVKYCLLTHKVTWLYRSAYLHSFRKI
jgi:hypothetical protein